MKLHKETFGEQNGNTVYTFTMTNDKGMEVSCINLGCTITKILTPDHNGNFENIVLGFETFEQYRVNPPFFGAVCGRVAGRIQDAQFELEGKKYQLAANDGKNHLHGGNQGFSHVYWEGTMLELTNEVAVEFSYVSPDGEEGYPGTLHLKVRYSLNNDNELRVTYSGLTDKTTLFNITNHSYFNLSGNAKRDVLNHELTLKSNQFVELNDNLIPTGILVDVEGTTFDFRSGRSILEGVNSEYHQNVLAGHGYDHPFVLQTNNNQEITLFDPESGRLLVVETDEPSVVVYSANQMGDGLVVNQGRTSTNHLGICLETQGFPDAINQPYFPSVILEKGIEHKTETRFKFSIER